MADDVPTRQPTDDVHHMPTSHARLLAWVREVAQLTQPDHIEWCDGSDEEWDRLTTLLEERARSSG